MSGARPVLTVGRNYPYNETYTHILGYVSEASVQDIVNNEIIKQRNVPGLRVGKTGLEKSFENDLIGTNGVQRYEVNAFGKRIKQVNFQKGDKGKEIINFNEVFNRTRFFQDSKLNYSENYIKNLTKELFEKKYLLKNTKGVPGGVFSKKTLKYFNSL